MNILRALHHEEKKLLVSQEQIEGKLHGIRAAINAMNGAHANGTERKRGQRHYKMSRAHRMAIKEGIRKAKAAK